MDEKLRQNIIIAAKRIKENSLYAFKSHYNSSEFGLQYIFL